MMNPYPGISMHKGYAFVQFTNPFDARSACMGEDGRNVFGQILDVNLVAEPKPHQIGRKRPNVAKAAADWEQFYDSYNAGATLASNAAAAAASGTRLTPPLKRPRLVVPSVRQQQQRAQSPKKVLTTPALDDLRSYSSPDILICGNCRELFSNLSDFLDHRKQYCKLRFTCKCSSFNASNRGDESASLMCALCKENFASAWDLMVHAQAAHMVNIYQLSTKDGSQDSTTGSTAGSDVATNEVNTDNSSAESGIESNANSSNSSKQDGAHTVKENGLSEGEGQSDMLNGSSSSAVQAMTTSD